MHPTSTKWTLGIVLSSTFQGFQNIDVCRNLFVALCNCITCHNQTSLRLYQRNTIQGELFYTFIHSSPFSLINLYDSQESIQISHLTIFETRTISLIHGGPPLEGSLFWTPLRFWWNKILVLLRFEFPILVDCALVKTRTLHPCCWKGANTPFSLTFEILPVKQDVGVVGRRSSPFCFLQNISSVKQVAVSHSAGQNSRRLDK